MNGGREAMSYGRHHRLPPKGPPKGVNEMIQEVIDRYTSMSPEQVDAEYAARRAVYEGKHRA